MELKWNSLGRQGKYRIYAAKFHDLKLLLIYTDFGYKGCYCVNSPALENIGKYHFYTNAYDKNKFIRSLCLFPNDMVYPISSKDKWIGKVNEKLELWFENDYYIWKYNVDFIGQEHGKYRDEIYKLMNKGMTYRDAKQIVYNNKQSYDAIIDLNSEAAENNSREFINEILKSGAVCNFIAPLNHLDWEKTMTYGNLLFK